MKISIECNICSNIFLLLLLCERVEDEKKWNIFSMRQFVSMWMVVRTSFDARNTLVYIKNYEIISFESNFEGTALVTWYVHFHNVHKHINFFALFSEKLNFIIIRKSIPYVVAELGCFCLIYKKIRIYWCFYKIKKKL